MRITTCLTSAMVPLQPSGSALDAAELPPTAAAAGPRLQPAVTAAAAPSPVYCRNRRRLRPGTNLGPGCRGDPAAPCARSRGSSELAILVLPPRFMFVSHAWHRAKPVTDHKHPSRVGLLWPVRSFTDFLPPVARRHGRREH